MDSEVKILKTQINIQKKALKDELALSSKSMEKWSLLGAVFLGAVLGFFGTEISALRRRKEEQREKQKLLKDNIVADSLKFVFKMRDIISDIYIDKKTHLELKKIDSEITEEFHSSIFRKYDEEMKEGFFTELNFYSYQLRRLNNQEIWKEFSSVVDAQDKLLSKLIKDDLQDDIKNELSQSRALVKEFTSYCIEISKV